MKPPGSVNAYIMAGLFDKENRYIGACPYMPAPIANAIKANPAIHYVKAKYPGFAEEVKTAEDYRAWM
jgi:hypothetical protein